MGNGHAYRYENQILIDESALFDNVEDEALTTEETEEFFDYLCEILGFDRIDAEYLEGRSEAFYFGTIFSNDFITIKMGIDTSGGSPCLFWIVEEDESAYDDFWEKIIDDDPNNADQRYEDALEAQRDDAQAIIDSLIPSLREAYKRCKKHIFYFATSAWTWRPAFELVEAK